MSAHQLQHYPWTTSTVDNLVKQYHNSMVRAAVYIEEGGYLTDPAGMMAKAKIIIDAAIANDIYVIVDWHGVGGNPNKYTAQARTFFQEMTAAYGKYPHVLYEIYNEPTVSWSEIKTYANEIIPLIRANAPENIILVGTPTYCAAPQEASHDLLSYVLAPFLLRRRHQGVGRPRPTGQCRRASRPRHADFRQRMGYFELHGRRRAVSGTAQKWLDFMAEHKLSWANWSLATKSEGSAFLKPNASMSGPWTDADLSPAGLVMKDKF